eukprot:CAMPEP_0173465342 /NCGR_PEP_ID=MMETSP1357-20121228/71468_1 /TAXON_ID=77926 /ORGANISM="Hemiselmis rufescens, Strain PCC563" /LENGTH=94 /DNA_ID=CAMNT_0014433319 /DNA_START=11 /DNA_END=292 /DNA_ORIENTATION=+
MTIAGGEMRKLALMGPGDESVQIRRGLPLFAQTCAKHLSGIETVVVNVSVDAGLIRNGPKVLDLEGADLGCEELIVAAEMMRANPSLSSVSMRG